eukprot:IDg11705t1
MRRRAELFGLHLSCMKTPAKHEGESGLCKGKRGAENGCARGASPHEREIWQSLVLCTFVDMSKNGPFNISRLPAFIRAIPNGIWINLDEVIAVSF